MSKVRDNAILAMTPGADHSEKEGYFVKLSAGNPIVVTAATEIPFGVIFDGEDTDGQDSIGVCGGTLPTCHVKLAGTVSKGNTLQLEADGRVIVDAATGARVLVAVALEDGVANDLIEAVILTPVSYS